MDSNVGIINTSDSEIEKSESDEIENINNRQEEPNIVENSLFDLPLGKALTLKDTYRITASKDTKFVVFAGPSGCGKTTLVTSLYQLFLKGIVGDYYFVRSNTLQGFESRAFYTRVISNSTEPQTIKTRVGMSESILHLELWNCTKNEKATFLLSDFSGEDFRSSIANIDVMRRDFSIIKRADIVVVLVDGEKITNLKTRNSCILQLADLIRTISDAGLFASSVLIEIVVSKYDIVIEKSIENPEIKSFLEKKITSLVDLSKNVSGAEVVQFNITAMPRHTDNINVGEGVGQMLESWFYTTKKTKSSNIFNRNSSQFDKFYSRIFGEING